MAGLVVGAGRAEVPRLVQQSAGWFIELDTCAVVGNRGVDSVAEIRDREGRVVRRAGTWRGREGHYLVVVPEAGESVLLHSLERPLAEGDVALQPCPPELPEAGVEAFARAQDIRLRAYFGESLEEPAGPLLAAAAEAFASTNLPGWLGHVRYEQGAWLRARGSVDEAEVAYRQSRLAYAGSGDARGEASALNQLGLLAWRANRLPQAVDYYRQAAVIRHRLGDLHPLAMIWNNLGLIATDAGDQQQALEYFDAALSVQQGEVNLRLHVDPAETDALADRLTEATGNLALALNTLNNLALLRMQRGELELAERYWNNYLLFEDHLAKAAAPAQARLNLGTMLLAQGRLDEAMLLLTSALEAFERGEHGRWQAEARVQLAALYLHLGDHRGAVQHAVSATAVDQQDARTRTLVLHRLGRIHRVLGDFESAHEHLQQAARLIPADSELTLAWQLATELAGIELELGRLESARRRLDQALHALDHAGMPVAVAAARSTLAELELQTGRPERALLLLEAALQVQQDAGLVFAELETLERMGRAMRMLGDSRELEVNRRALVLADQLLTRPLPPVRLAEFRTTLRDIHGRHLSALLKHAMLDEAWRVARQAREQPLVGLRQQHQRAVQRDRRVRLLDRHGELVEQLAAWRGAVDQNDTAGADQADPLRRELDRTEVELARLARPAGAIEDEQALAQLQARLGPHQALLAWDLLAGHSLLWVVTREQVRVEPLADPQALAAELEALLQHVRHPRNAPGRIELLVQRLRQRLLQPVEDVLEGMREVLILPDGMLHSLPTALVFNTPDHDVDPRLVRTLLSTRVEAAQQERKRRERRILVMADPGSKMALAAQIALPEESLLTRMGNRGQHWQLPGTRAEARAIASLASQDVEVELRSGALANREFLLSEALSGFGILHLATHGLIDLEYPSLSALLLGGDMEGTAFLRPHEIAQLNLNAELVVLSACETGLGKTFAGSGAFSLARPFLVAGAHQVLASLWKVDDHRTAIFMQRFYHHLLTESKRPAEALAHTQRWMQNQPATAHPYYWAGFVLTSAGL